MKKLYIVPETQVSYATPCNIFAVSSWTEVERINYLCPHIPADTRCGKYNRWVRGQEGVLENPSNVPEHLRISTRSTLACPYKGTCSRWKKYMETVNER